ncbi:MAG: type II toxin-antitoxin system PemK/MazF family toxin [Candidatus Pacebacteria bacterium]|nr:type II toxin-antitoxin system PemK/MazF family toxin [Candidatus Paceibacterota bacterium]
MDSNQTEIFCNKREVWWCSFGLNVGSELCGKNEFFERPVIVLKVFNRNTIKVIPLTSKIKKGKYYFEVDFNNIKSYASLSQVKTISTKRLSRKMGRLNNKQFLDLINVYKNSI